MEHYDLYAQFQSLAFNLDSQLLMHNNTKRPMLEVNIELYTDNIAEL